MSKRVYVVHRRGGPTRIGVSKDPAARLKDLRSPDELSLVWEESRQNDAQQVERAAHYLLREKHLGGEWFDVSPENAVSTVRRAIKLIEDGRPAPFRLWQIEKRSALSPMVIKPPKETGAALRRAAKDDERSVSSMASQILRQWLTARGYLPSPE